MFKFFTKITADDYGMLMNDTPASRRKVILLATSLFIPVLIWIFSAFAMSTKLFGASLICGCLYGLSAGTIIFFVDRSIILANGNRWITLFRLVMGFCIATIGSIMVDECIFHDDINQQFETNKTKHVDIVKKEIDFKFSSDLANANRKVNQQYIKWMESESDVKGEADGKSGSGQRGVGKIVTLKAEISKKFEAEYRRAVSSRDSLLNEKEKIEQIAENKIVASYGNAMLLKRIEALFDLVVSNKIVGLIYFLFTVIIWCLEFLVILFKLNSAETNYERKVRIIEQIGEQRMDKILKTDCKWYHGSQGHDSTKKLRTMIKQGPPTFMN